MRKKLLFLLVVSLFGIGLLKNSDVGGAWYSTTISGVEDVYSYLESAVYWDVTFTYSGGKTAGNLYWQIPEISANWYGYNRYVFDDTYSLNMSLYSTTATTDTWRCYWNLTNFTPGDYTFKVYHQAYSYATTGAYDEFAVSSDPPTYYPQISITAPEVYEAFDVSSVSSITTTATLEDDGYLTDAEVFWDSTEMWNWTSFVPGENTKSYGITITDGVTTNGTHTITWRATDNDDNIWNKTRNVVVYDGILAILMQKPENYWQRTNSFQFQANFSDTNGLDEARMYIYGCTFIGTDKVVVINNVESFLSYLQNYTITDDFYVYSYSLTYSNVLKWLEDNGYDDTGNKYGDRYGDWYIDDSGTLFSSLSNDLQVDDNGNRYWEYLDEYYADSGAYSSAIVSYDEDDMSVLTGTNPEYSYYKDITLTNPTSTAFTNFVAYIYVAYDSDMQSDFDDVAFYTSDGSTLLDFDKGEYTASTSARFWVEIPSITGSGTYTTRMYYGNATMSSLEDESGTYDDNNIVLVMHLADATDSSGNGYDFSVQGDVDFNAGKIGTGMEGFGSQDFLSVTSTCADLDALSDDWTILVWGNFDTNAIHGIFAGVDDGMSARLYPYSSVDSWYYTCDGETDTGSNGDAFDINGWYAFGWRHEGTDLDYFLNGAQQDTDVNSGDIDSSGQDYYIGMHSDGTSNDLDGELDELFVVSEVWGDDEVNAFYQFQANQGTYVSVGSETSNFGAWNEGENFDWTVSSTTGERDSNHMTFWNTTAGAQGSVYVSDNDLANTKLLDDNYALSFEINISCNDLTHIDAIGFSIEGTTGNYLKFALTRWGYGICGASTNALSTNNMVAGYTQTDISWDGSWTTLNITILGHSKVLYYYNDTLLRDSVSDNQYYDYTDTDCGSTTLSVDNYSGEVNGNMTIDYYNTSYFPGGRINPSGYLYYEYSDPACVRYNGSWYLSTQTASDVCSLYSNWGGGAWHSYRYNNNIKYTTRIKFDDEDLTPYGQWQTWGVCATINGTDDYWFQIHMSTVNSDVYYILNTHYYGGYSKVSTASTSYTIDMFDGEWHTLSIIVQGDDGWTSAHVDGNLIANVTDDLWMDCWDKDDAENGLLSWSVYTNAGATANGIMEIDYWRVYNYTYNWYTESDGLWDWSLGSGCHGDRTATGEMYIYDDFAGSYDYIWVNDPTTQFYGTSQNQYLIEALLSPQSYEDNYTMFEMTIRLSASEYYIMSLYTNDTLIYGTYSSWSTTQSGSWTTRNTLSFTWTEDDWYKFTFVADVTNDWVAFMVNDSVIENSTYTVTYTLNDYLILVDNSAGDHSALLYIDYVRSGWTDNWWWQSSSGWDWDTWSTGTTVGYQNGYRDDTNGEFYFYSTKDDGDAKITAQQSDGLNWSGSYWTAEIRFQICNTTSHYDYVGASAWIGGDTYIKCWWDYGASGFRFGLYNNTNGAGDASNSVSSALDTTYNPTMDNNWHTIRFQMRTNAWVGLYLDEKLYYNYSYAFYPYITGNFANISFSLDTDSAQNTRMVKIDYLKTGWTYGEYWGQSNESWVWEMTDSDYYNAFGYRDDTNGYFDFYDGASDGFVNIVALYESYWYASTWGNGDGLYVAVNLTLPNATANYDGVNFGARVGSGKYMRMFWSGSTLKYGIDTNYAVTDTTLGVYSDTTTLSWTSGVYHLFEMFVNYTTGITTWWLDDTLLYNTTTLSAHVTDSSASEIYLGVDSDAGDISHLRVDYLMTGYKGWYNSNLSETGLTNYANNTLPATWGEDIMIVHNSTIQCRFDATATFKVNSTYYEIFNGSALTTQTETWSLTDYVWSTYISEGSFTVSVYLESDVGTIWWHNFTMYRDNTAPTLGVRLKPTEPTGVYYADYPPGLDIYALEWGLNDGQDNLVVVNMNDGDRIYNWIVTEEKPENFPTQVEYITRIEGNHTVLVRAIDNAGNEDNETITFTIVRRKPITFSFIASSGDAIPDYIAESYRIEINGFATDGLTGYTIYDTFTLGIYDVFDQTLYYGGTVSYSANLQITLSTVHRVTFSNPEPVPVEITVQKTSGQQTFICAGSSDMTWYLEQDTYKIIANPNGAMRTKHTQYVATDFDLAVTSAGTNTVTIILDFIEVDGTVGFSFSSVTDMLNISTWGILIVVIISSVVIIRRLRPPLMRIEDQVVPKNPFLPQKKERKWRMKKSKTSFKKEKPKEITTSDGKWVDIFA